MVCLLSLIFMGIITLEAPGLIKKKMWRELAAFGIVLVIGMIYSFGLALDLPLPNPTVGVEAVFKPLSEYLDKILS